MAAMNPVSHEQHLFSPLRVVSSGPLCDLIRRVALLVDNSDGCMLAEPGEKIRVPLTTPCGHTFNRSLLIERAIEVLEMSIQENVFAMPTCPECSATFHKVYEFFDAFYPLPQVKPSDRAPLESSDQILREALAQKDYRTAGPLFEKALAIRDSSVEYVALVKYFEKDQRGYLILAKLHLVERLVFEGEERKARDILRSLLEYELPNFLKRNGDERPLHFSLDSLKKKSSNPYTVLELVESRLFDLPEMAKIRDRLKALHDAHHGAVESPEEGKKRESFRFFRNGKSSSKKYICCSSRG